MLIREQLEQREILSLASYALKNTDSRGRVSSEVQDDYRLDFARDRDRILHTKAFRRLKGKTQVFVAHYGDHYRSRLTHSLEVAQVARTLARIFRANEDVAEAVALAHDIGHTPFGHAGQEVLAKKMKAFGRSFEHNAQSRRILEIIEPKNLCKETLQCLCKHPTNQEKKEYDLSSQNYLEGQIVDISDYIAYTCHDLQDGLRSGLLLPEKFKYVPPNLIDVLVRDIAEQGLQSLENINSPQDILNMETGILRFSKDVNALSKKLRSDLFEQLYRHPLVLEQTDKGEQILSDIFDFLMENFDTIPGHFEESAALEIRVRDFVAGMTDSFAEEFWKQSLSTQ